MKIRSFILACMVTNQLWASGQNFFEKPGPSPNDDCPSISEALTTGTLKNQCDYNNPPLWEWAKKIGGSGADIINGMVPDGNGNFFIVGSFSGITEFEVSNLTSVGLSDGFVAKLNPDLDVEWIRQISGSVNDGTAYGKDITIDNEGNLIVTGTFTSPTLTMGSITLTRLGITDVFIAKYDNSGNALWAENIENLYSYVAADKVIADDLGNLYVRASSATIYKFSESGLLIWESPFLMLLSDFNIKNSVLYVSGSFWQSVTLGSSTINVANHGICLAQISMDDGTYLNAELLATSSATQSGRQPLVKSFQYDNSGNLYLSGYYYSELSCGSQSVTTSSYYYTSFIAKFTNSICQWLIGAITPGSNTVNAINFDSDQNPVISGNMSSGLSFGGTQIDFIYNGYSAEFNAGNGDIAWTSSLPNAAAISMNSSNIYYSGSYQFNGFFRKCDLSGNLVSMKVFSSDSGSGNIKSIETDETGVYVLGSANSSGDFFGITHSSPESELAIAKLDHNGTILWHYFIANATPQNDAGGNALILDKANGKLSFIANYHDVVTVGNQTFDASGETRNFIAQYSTDGAFSWAYDLGMCYPNCLAADNTGNVSISGTFIDQMQLGDIPLTGAGSMDVFLAKFTAVGQLDWAQRAGGEGMEYNGIISVDAQANIYLTGEFTSVDVDFNGQNPITLNDGDGHVILVKYSSAGNLEWVKSHSGTTQIGEEHASWPCAIKTDASGNSYIHGWFGKSNIFGNFTLTSLYNYNYFVAKFDMNGNVVWAKPILEKQYGFNYCEIDTDEEGNCYSSGQIRDTCYFGDIMVERQSAYNDLFVAKYSSSDGTLEWIKTISGISSSSNYVNGIAVYNKNSLYLGGYFTDIYNFDNIVLDTRQGANGFIGLLGQKINSIDSPGDTDLAGIQVYPNPANSSTCISFKQSLPGAYHVEIINLSGQKVYSQDFISAMYEQTINLTDLAIGTYLVKVKNGNLTVIRKLVIN